jgi:mono/diheme cytochrome c family protein
MEEGFLDRPGNEKRGARVFELRGCAVCHGPAGRALPKRDWRAEDMVAAVWRHGPAMREQMQREGVRWPMLSEADMADVIAWLYARE